MLSASVLILLKSFINVFLIVNFAKTGRKGGGNDRSAPKRLILCRLSHLGMTCVIEVASYVLCNQEGLFADIDTKPRSLVVRFMLFNHRK